MNTRKADLRLPTRTPAYVSREVGAAELGVSPGTWDAWVAGGRLPKVAPGFPASTPRWRWQDVDAALSGRPIASEASPPELSISQAKAIEVARNMWGYRKKKGRRRTGPEIG